MAKCGRCIELNNRSRRLKIPAIRIKCEKHPEHDDNCRACKKYSKLTKQTYKIRNKAIKCLNCVGIKEAKRIKSRDDKILKEYNKELLLYKSRVNKSRNS